MEPLRRLWNAFKNVAIVFSFVVNFVLVIVLLMMILPPFQGLFAIKARLAEPVLDNLDAAFVGLGESTIETTVNIDQQIPIEFNLPLDQQLPINFPLSIDQETVVVLSQDVPLNVAAPYYFPGGGGMINGTVHIVLPAGLPLPVHLSMVVPVAQTVPVQMNVPVSQTIPIQMTVPVSIKLGEAGLGPAVEDLRGVFHPLRTQLDRVPDGLFGRE